MDAKDLMNQPNLNIEQNILIGDFLKQFAPRITNIIPVVFQGIFTGHEVLTYAATKMYLCLSLVAQHTAALTTTGGSIQYYDAGNVLNGYICNNGMMYDTVTPAIDYVKNWIKQTNFSFSRVVNNQYSYFKFIGYRITLI